jgi:hypothetical protein
VRKIFAISLLLYNFLTISDAFSFVSSIKGEGGSDGGGGYSFYYTSFQHIKQNADLIIDATFLLNENQKSQFRFACKNYLLNSAFKFLNDFPLSPNLNACEKMDFDRMRGILFNIEYDLKNESWKKNPAGMLEPLSISYSTKNGERLIVHRSLMDRLNKHDLKKEESDRLQRELIHEASHLMGIGLSHDIDSYYISAAATEFLKNPQIFLETWGLQ